jgi:hypothetical protein
MRLTHIKPISDAATRYEMKQLADTFVINMLKDLLRANYEAYQKAGNKQAYCLDLITFGFAQIWTIGANDDRIWNTNATPFGNERVISKFGSYLLNVHRRYSEWSVTYLLSVVEAARAKVDD